MATTAGRQPVSLDRKEKETRKEKYMEEDQKKNKMGQEIEEIFRANKKKRKEAPGAAGQNSKKVTVATGKEDKKVNKKKASKEEKENKKKKSRFLVDESSENRSKRRRTAEGFAIYTEDELGIGNQDTGNTPLCPFDCSCCF